MFEALTAQPPDAIMHLMELCRTDTNPNKIDLGAGVYKTTDGAIPIMKAVKKAEQLRWYEEETKTYVGTTGNVDFRTNLLNVIIGADMADEFAPQLSSSQTAGGSGALRMGAELIKNASPDATVWVSTPTWANHTPLIGSTGLKIENYPYYNRETLGVDFDNTWLSSICRSCLFWFRSRHERRHIWFTNPDARCARANFSGVLFKELRALPRACRARRHYE